MIVFDLIRIRNWWDPQEEQKGVFVKRYRNAVRAFKKLAKLRRKKGFYLIEVTEI